MKISTVKKPAEEMAIKAPEQADLELIKKIIPHPDTFPFPTPDEVMDAYRNVGDDLLGLITKETRQYITGKKEKGQGMAIASYPKLYEKAIQPLEYLWPLKDQPQKVVDYLLENPIYYKKSVDEKMVAIEQKRDAGVVTKLDIAEYVACCFSNLMDWLYLSSIPVHQYLREQLLEKARHLRRMYSQSEFGKGFVFVLPQRTTTSRSLGENETELHRINAGYRMTKERDPWSGEIFGMLHLVTWFYTDSQTKIVAFKDYIDVINGNLPKALSEMRRRELYRKWAANMSPREYANACSAWRIDDANVASELEGLTKITEDIDESTVRVENPIV